MANILQERERTFTCMLSSIAKCSCVDNKQSDMLHLPKSLSTRVGMLPHIGLPSAQDSAPLG